MLTLFILCFLVTSVQLQEEEDLYEPLPDYYAILNVTHEASVREIKKSFRKLAMDFHPDKNKTEGAQIIFQELSEAYSILSDPEKKAEYDELFNIFYDLDEYIVVEESTEEVVLEEESFNEENFEVPESESSDDFIQQEDFSNTEPDSGSAKTADDSQPEDPSELDDETLMKVLKFLADNDYIITKRTRRIPRSNNGDSQSEEQSSTTSSSGTNTDDQKTGSHSQAYNTVPPPPHQQHQQQESSGSRTTRSTHAHHGHTWSASHQHKPRFEGYATGRTSSSSRYHNSGHNSSGGSYSSGQHGGYHSSGQHGSSGGGYQRYKSSEEARVYCRTSTRWEGTVKITSKSCF